MLYSVQSGLVLAAAENGDDEVLKQLSERGLDQDLLNEALSCAACHGHVRFTQTCCSLGADINWWDSSEDETALSIACREGHADVVAVMIESGCDVNLKVKGQMHTALHSCAVSGSVKCVRLLIAAKADVNSQDCMGNTPMIKAVMEEKPSIVRELLAVGANYKLLNIRQKSAFSIAMDRGDAGCVKELLTAHKDLANIRGQLDNLYPLTRAIRYRQLPVIRAFIESGCDINCPESTFLKPLHLAIEIGDASLVETLAMAGADINSTLAVPIGATPLLLAVAKGLPDVVTVLGKTDCHLNAFDGVGRSALYMAVKFGNTRCIKSLLECGANPDAYNWDHSSQEIPDIIPSPPPLHAALIYERQEEAAMLLQAGCDVDFPAFYRDNHRSDWVTPMQLARLHDLTWAMKMLLKAGSKCLVPVEGVPNKDDELVYLLQKAHFLLTNSHSLKDLCRHFIRQILGKRLIVDFQTLPLPQSLLAFIIFEELIPD